MRESSVPRGRRPQIRSVLTSPWRKALAVLALLTALFSLAACRTAAPDPAPTIQPEFDLELELAHLDLPVDEANRVRFLPPLAKRNPAGHFAAELDLEIRFFNVDPATRVARGNAVGPTLSTSKRTIVAQRDVYATLWPALSLGLDRKASQYLRAEIRLPGGPNQPVCNEAAERCLGSLDVYAFKGLWLGRQHVPDGFVPLPALVGVLPIGFKVLAEPTTPVPGPAPTSIDDLIGVSGENLSRTQGNCVSSFLTRPGQGLQAVGAGLQAVGAMGGLFQGPTSAFTSAPVDPSSVGAELYDQLHIPNNLDSSAVVFVVDDFRNGYELPAALFEPNPDLAALAPLISHGALVMHHLRGTALAMFPDSTVEWVSGSGPGGQPYYLLPAGEGGLYLQAIDVGEYDTDSIPNLVREAISTYGAANGAFQVYDMVVNMSFAIVPCSVLHDFEAASHLQTFEDYLAALADTNAVDRRYMTDLDELVSTPVNLADDALLRYLACPFPEEGTPYCDGNANDGWALFDKLFHVASAGNYGNGYPLYPAAAPSVISVGSLETAGGSYRAAAYSNRAEIAAPGGLFTLVTQGGSTVAYAGTSFAAPEVSLFLAVDSMMRRARCPVPDVMNSAPPALAHGTYDMEPFYRFDDAGDGLSKYCINPY